ncbi:SGNH/GDSL hydrolase family protein [Leifsonia sp. AG29]|uniref:SGNH/GDSL hydrolase family protein n=1 Tax=Leifsonia sp. AG29 TaxID=2598860 RepID=UPI00131B1DDA|nr:SGNH/GDSL hydrolase family protein [Leifsonia sp. AG29]
MGSTARTLGAITVAGAAVGAAAAAGWAAIRRKRLSVAEAKILLNETLPVHSKWWRDEATVEGEIVYVALGDSAAQGIGASRPKNGYVGIIADHLRAVTGRSVRVVNLSVSGATVALAAADQLPRFSTLKPDIVTVCIGANDIPRFDERSFRAGIREVLAAVPDDAIIADLPYFYLPWNERKVAQGNRIIREEAAERALTVVSLNAAMRRYGIRGAFTQFAEDLFHPNDHGYRVWASAFLPAVTELARAKFPRRPAASAASSANSSGEALSA